MQKEPKCDVLIGSGPFTVSVILSELGVPDLDGDDVAGYTGFQARINFPSALTRKDRSDTDEAVWPACGFAAESKGASTYLLGCAFGGGQESTYLGSMMEVDFNCTQAGSLAIDLAMGTNDTYLLDEQGHEVLPVKGDSVVINCIDADSDGDGCSNAQELGPIPAEGGQRDPLNPWDYFNPTGDKVNRTDDIVAVVLKYGHDQGLFGDYDVKYDRTALMGGHPWQFGPPNGTIRTADIAAAVLSFGHDCA